MCYPLPNGGFELPVSPVCVTPYHKTVVAVNAPSARVTEGAPIKNTLSLPNSAQTHQNDDDGLLTHPQDLDAPYRSVLSKCSLRVREAECAHSSGGRGKHVDVQLSHMYVFSHVCILTHDSYRPIARSALAPPHVRLSTDYYESLYVCLLL